MSNNPVDITGRRFGRLVAVSITPLRTARGSVGWLVRCDCGVEEIRSAHTLLHSESLLQACRECQHSKSVARSRERAAETPSGRAPNAKPGVCSWCSRAADELLFECSACNRAARRNGRDETGRPVRIGRAEGARRASAAKAKAAKPVSRGVAAFERRMGRTPMNVDQAPPSRRYCSACTRSAGADRYHARSAACPLSEPRAIPACRWCGEPLCACLSALAAS